MGMTEIYMIQLCILCIVCVFCIVWVNLTLNPQNETTQKPLIVLQIRHVVNCSVIY